MHDSATGLVSTDAGQPGDPLVRIREALSLFNATAKAACDLSEHQLQRVAEDAAARCVGFIEIVERQRAIEERQRGSEGVHGEDPQAPQVVLDLGDFDRSP